jgi:Ca2+-binding EF-hand superfamily protein
MRLGLSAGAPPKSNAGFQFVSSNETLIAFDRPTAAARMAATSAALSSTKASLAASQAKSTRGSKAGTEPFEPPRAQLAGLKLTFKGFFQEAVPESPIESSRKRNLVIQYHLVDDMTMILEPGERNDGLSHGQFLKKMPLPQVTLDTLRVGADLEICGRVIHLTACDDFSRNYFAGIGIDQPENEPEDKDDWTKTQEVLAKRNDPDLFHGVKSSAITRFIEAVNGSSRASSFKKDMKGRFLEHGNDKLSFLVLWDDSKYEGDVLGSVRKFWLIYFLATEVVDIKEAKGEKTVAAWPTLLKRRRLPKFVLAHDDRMRSAEDVTGDEDYYNENDLIVGQSINVFGRKFILADCDKATQLWYMKNKGINQKINRIIPDEPEIVVHEVPIPPHQGIGSEEDTLAAFKHLIPRKRPVDLAKMRSLTYKTEKYLCNMISNDPINADRVFRITVHLDDDDIAVFEPPTRNSGLNQGIFQKKMKTKDSATGQVLTRKDIFVGAVVTIKAQKFKVFEHEKSKAAPVADVPSIIATLRLKLLDASHSMGKMFRKFDLDHSQTMSFVEFQNMLNYYSLGLTKYEAITLFKAFEDKPGFMSYLTFVSAFSAADENVHKKGADGKQETKTVNESAAENAARYTEEELDAFIEEAKAHALHEEEVQAQEVLLSRIARSFKNAKSASAVHENFRRFDINKDHLIDENEFRMVMGGSGLNLSTKDVETLVKKFYDPNHGNGDEFLDYEEFMSLIHQYADKVIRS